MEMDESFVLPVAHGYNTLELDRLIPDKAFRKEVFRLRDTNGADMVSFVISDFYQAGIGLPTNPLDYTRAKPLKGVTYCK